MAGERLFNEVKKDITEHLGKGELYEVIPQNCQEDGKTHLYVDNNEEFFQVYSYDWYWTNAPHFFEMPERGKSIVVDGIRDIFGDDVAIMALWERGSVTRDTEGKFVFKENVADDNGCITDFNVTYFVVKKNKKKLQSKMKNDKVVAELFSVI